MTCVCTSIAKWITNQILLFLLLPILTCKYENFLKWPILLIFFINIGLRHFKTYFII
jgi:hypothetical protein